MKAEIQHNKVSEELIIRKSIFVLIIKGAWTWFILLALILIADQVIKSLSNTYALPYLVLPSQNQISFDGIIRFLLLVLMGAVLLYVVLSWINEYYIVRDDDVTKKHGVWIVNKEEFDFEYIDSVTMHQGIMGRVFNFGSVLLSNPRTGDIMMLDNIQRPQEVAKKIEQLLYTYKAARTLP